MTTGTLSLSNLTNRANGYYSVDVSDVDGTSRSAAIFLAVAPQSTRVQGWGYNFFAQTEPPAALNDAIVVAAGNAHALSLKRNGTVVAWGSFGNGQTVVPDGLSGVVMVAAGGYHSLALKADGTVAAWGWNGDGQTAIPVGLSSVVEIAGGDTFSLALRNNGSVNATPYMFTTIAGAAGGLGSNDGPGSTGAVPISLSRGSGRPFLSGHVSFSANPSA